MGSCGNRARTDFEQLRPCARSWRLGVKLAAVAMAGSCAVTEVAGAQPQASERRAAVAWHMLGSCAVPGAEIPAFDPHSAQLLVACAHGVEAFALDPAGALTPVAAIASDALTAGPGATVSHVAVDPLGRGFAAVTVIPAASASELGRVVFLGLDRREPPPTGEAAQLRLLSSIDAGFGPDHARFSSDGRWLVVANEGQPVRTRAGSLLDPPGSVTVVDLSTIRSAEDLAQHGSVVARHAVFGTALVGESMARGERIRLDPTAGIDPARDLEPESSAIVGACAIVVMQENSAAAFVDLPSASVVGLVALPLRPITIDASDRDGVRADHTVWGWPMPDHVVAWPRGDRWFIATADEGDDRGEIPLHSAPPGRDVWGRWRSGADSARLAELAHAGWLDTPLASTVLGDAHGIGRLKVSAIEPDASGGWGPIDRPIAQGTRSVSVWELTPSPSGLALTLALDSGTMLEREVAARMPDLYNTNGSGGAIDERSDDRGPEPEGLALLTVPATSSSPERLLLITTLERPGILATFDVSEPARIELVGLEPAARQGFQGPEGVIAIPAHQSPTGRPVLVVGFETSGHLAVFEIR